MHLTRRQTIGATVAVLAAAAPLSAGAQSGDEAAVTRAVDAFMSAYAAVDKVQLEALLAPELSYGHVTGDVETRQQLIDRLVSGVGVPKSIELSDRRVTIVGDNAIVRHNFTAEAVNRAGQPVPIRISVMEIWQTRGGNWVMLAHQAYPRPTTK